MTHLSHSLAALLCVAPLLAHAGAPIVTPARNAVLVYSPTGTLVREFCRATYIDYDNSPIWNGVYRSTGVELGLRVEGSTGCGARIPAYNPADPEYPIYVGETAKALEDYAWEISNLDRDGYIIHFGVDYGIVYGRWGDTATGDPSLYAEYDVARRWGVEWYIYGPLGAEAPAATEIELDYETTTEEPVFRGRQWTGQCAQVEGWRFRVGGQPRYPSTHDMHKVVPPSTYGYIDPASTCTPGCCDYHPEYYPVLPSCTGAGFHLDGDRCVPVATCNQVGEDCVCSAQHYGWQPDFTNASVRQLAFNYIDNYFSANPDAEHISLGVNDSHGFCCCPTCSAMYPPGASPCSADAHAYRLWDFYGDVATQVQLTWPGRLVTVMLYHEPLCYVPSSLPDNLFTFVTGADPACELLPPTDHWGQIERWGAVSEQVGIYDYLQGSGFMIPRIYPTTYKALMDHAAASHGVAMRAEAHPNWALDGPKLWLAEKLAWDPALALEPLMVQWHAAMFKEAAPQARAYFDHLAAAYEAHYDTREQWGYKLDGTAHKPEQLGTVFPPSVCLDAESNMAAAQLAATTPIVQQRLELYAAGLGVACRTTRRYALANDYDAMPETEHACERAVAYSDWLNVGELDSYMASFFGDHNYGMYKFCGQTEYPAGVYSEWDTKPIYHNRLVDKLVAQNLDLLCPQTKAHWDALVDNLLWCSLGCEARGHLMADYASARAKMDPIVKTAAITGEAWVGAPPVVDGAIEAAWGVPSFSGHLWNYPDADTPDDEVTEIWVRSAPPNLLYIAFKVHQVDPPVMDTLGDDVYPATTYFDWNDVVGFEVAHPDYVGRFALVTAAGSKFDGANSGGQYQPALWDGVTSWAAAAVTGGWEVELVAEIDGDPSVYDGLTAGASYGWGLFRIRGGYRQALVPQPSTKWHVSPGRRAVVIWE